MSAQRFWLLTMTGVTAARCAGLFSTEDAAQSHAVDLDGQSDHYHDWSIDEIEVDVPLRPRYLKSWEGSAPKAPRKDVPIEVTRIEATQ